MNLDLITATLDILSLLVRKEHTTGCYHDSDYEMIIQEILKINEINENRKVEIEKFYQESIN